MLYAAAAVFILGAAVFLPSRLMAQPTCGCNADCFFGDCSCGAYSTAASVCDCHCSFGQPSCHCYGY